MERGLAAAEATSIIFTCSFIQLLFINCIERCTTVGPGVTVMNKTKIPDFIMLII